MGRNILAACLENLSEGSEYMGVGRIFLSELTQLRFGLVDFSSADIQKGGFDLNPAITLVSTRGVTSGLFEQPLSAIDIVASFPGELSHEQVHFRGLVAPL